jgi:hypothetical protein
MSRFVSARILCETEDEAAACMEVLSRAVAGLAFQHDLYGTAEVGQNVLDDEEDAA